MFVLLITGLDVISDLVDPACRFQYWAVSARRWSNETDESH